MYVTSVNQDYPHTGKGINGTTYMSQLRETVAFWNVAIIKTRDVVIGYLLMFKQYVNKGNLWLALRRFLFYFTSSIIEL